MKQTQSWEPPAIPCAKEKGLILVD